MKLNRREKSLFFIPLLCLVFAAVLQGNWLNDLSWAIYPRGDQLEKASRKLTGWGAVDCGVVHASSDQHATQDACAIQSIKTGRAFRVRYEYSGIDSVMYQAIVGTREGRIYSLMYEHMIFYKPGELEQRYCPKARIVTVRGKEKIQLQ